MSRRRTAASAALALALALTGCGERSERAGADERAAARVVAPARVNGGRSSLMDLAPGPSPIMISS